MSNIIKLKLYCNPYSIMSKTNKFTWIYKIELHKKNSFQYFINIEGTQIIFHQCGHMKIGFLSTILYSEYL